MLPCDPLAPSPPDPGQLHRLARLVHAIETRSDHPQPQDVPRSVPTGWHHPSFPPPPASLLRGIIHEWFGPADPPHIPSASRQAEPWSPALCILTHFARQALAAADAASGGGGSGGAIIWIGRRCRPYPPLLTGPAPDGPSLLNRSLFVDPPDDAARLWAIELALRSPASIAVIADGSRLSMSASRRLQLAAKVGTALALIARPPGDLKQLSAAATRWTVHREPSDSSGPRWSVELVRCKGMQALFETRHRWIVEWNRAQSAVVVPAPLVHRSGEETRPALRIA